MIGQRLKKDQIVPAIRARRVTLYRQDPHSGVAMLEKTIGERRPDYVRYVARTNAFFPGPRRAASDPTGARQ
jgi:hypothetical protein